MVETGRARETSIRHRQEQGETGDRDKEIGATGDRETVVIGETGDRAW